MSKRQERDHIFKIVFLSLFNSETEMEDQEMLYLDDQDDLKDEERSRITAGAAAVLEHLDELDKIIGSYSRGWTIKRMGKVDLTLLRMAVYELKYEDTPKGVVINEAVELAKTYGGENSASFVNGILGQIVRSEDKQADDHE